MSSIKELQKLRESEDHIEFKEAKRNYPFAGGNRIDPKERRHCVLGYIVAIANERGGRLVLGMTDKIPHIVVGSDFAMGEIGAIEDEIYKRLRVRVRMEEIYENDKRVLVINIPSRPIGRLLRFEGIPLMRIGESLREMSDSEIYNILSEQEPDFSAQICEGLELKDLDEDAIKTMKTQYAEKQGNPIFKNLSDKQVLIDLELLKEDKLNYAALVLLGKQEAIRKYLPQNNIVVEFRPNNSMIQYTARKEFQLPLFIAIDKVWQYINQPACNPLLHYNDGLKIYDIPSFNREAIREAILNSVCHRLMNIKSDVVIKQYPDSLTITNAGGFPRGVDINNILTVNSTPRSKLMSDILQKTGLVERSGQGVDKMFYHCIMEGKALPDYSDTDPYQVSLTFKAPILDESFVRFIRHEQQSRDDNRKLDILKLLVLYKVCMRDFAELDISLAEELCSEGLLVVEKGYYKLPPDKYKSDLSDKLRSYNIKYLQMVAKCFKMNTFITSTMLSEYIGEELTLRQIRFLITKMQKSGFIKRNGKGKNTQYSKTDKFPNIN